MMRRSMLVESGMAMVASKKRPASCYILHKDAMELSHL